MVNQIEITKTAKYTTFGNPKSATTIIFALHGYGQLVDFFIRKFNYLDENKFFIVAPEGLHRFYLKGSSGRVGASWMTKEQRQIDINDYIVYLDTLWMTIQKKYKFEKRILLGFSQGGATASRWHKLGVFNADQLILWASVFPPDMEIEVEKGFKDSDNYLVFGNKDEYYKESKIDEHFEYLKNMNLEINLIKFKGNHNIDKETLLNLVR